MPLRTIGSDLVDDPLAVDPQSVGLKARPIAPLPLHVRVPLRARDVYERNVRLRRRAIILVSLNHDLGTIANTLKQLLGGLALLRELVRYRLLVLLGHYAAQPRRKALLGSAVLGPDSLKIISAL